VAHDDYSSLWRLLGIAGQVNIDATWSWGGICLNLPRPPFNQGKDYAFFDDELPPERYWQWLEEICAKVYALTAKGGAIYFMHRDKNGEQVLRLLREAG
jgi:site-specific DNA-methyltransferase (adenine-specific)